MYKKQYYTTKFIGIETVDTWLNSFKETYRVEGSDSAPTVLKEKDPPQIVGYSACSDYLVITVLY